MHDVALNVANLSFRFEADCVLEDICFAIPKASFCAVLGPNGAGKTTLIALLTQLLAPQAGTIEILGIDAGRQPVKALASLGVVFQTRALDLDLTVLENLRYQGALRGMPDALVRTRADEDLARLGLSDRADKLLRTLSGGQIRRVEIVRALLHRPSLLLLDEPTVGLDPATRREIHAHILSLRAEGVASLWCTHLFDEVVPDSRLIVLDHGKVLADDVADRVLQNTGAETIADAFDRLTGSARPAATA